MNDMSTVGIKVRTATKNDLDAINRIIEAAVMIWDLPERVKRLSLSSYYYTEQDLNHLELVVAEDGQKNIKGVAAWEHADNKNTLTGHTALLLHGIYVDPAYHHKGIGHQLFQCAEQTAHEQQCDGLLIKAQEDANGFFISEGMSRLPIEDSSRQYANRFWKKIDK